jgi:hypothetical protein
MRVTGRSWVTQPSRRFDAHLQLQLAPRWYGHCVKGAANLRDASTERQWKDSLGIADSGRRTERLLMPSRGCALLLVTSCLHCASCGAKPHEEASMTVDECLANRNVALLRETKGMSAKGRAKFEVQAAESRAKGAIGRSLAYEPCPKPRCTWHLDFSCLVAGDWHVVVGEPTGREGCEEKVVNLPCPFVGLVQNSLRNNATCRRERGQAPQPSSTTLFDPRPQPALSSALNPRFRQPRTGPSRRTLTWTAKFGVLLPGPLIGPVTATSHSS